METRYDKLIILLLVAILASIWITSLWETTETVTTTITETRTVTTTQTMTQTVREAVTTTVATTVILTITTCPQLDFISPLESLIFYPDSYIKVDYPSKLYLHVKNTGLTSAVIYKIEIVCTGDTVSVNYTVDPEQDITFTISLKGTYVAGTNYAVKIYTRAGNIYTITVQAR